MKLNLIVFFLSLIFFSSAVHAHTFTGMVGFYDGLSHPVLGIDHFLAMVSVGIVSAQIGGRAIWTIPATFVLMMIIGGTIGMLIEVFYFNLDAGSYIIQIFNQNNTGHYSLAVGEAEFFGSNLCEQILTWTPIILYIGPVMDIVHWQKFDIRAYIPHIALVVIIFLIYFIIKKLFFRKQKRFV